MSKGKGMPRWYKKISGDADGTNLTAALMVLVLVIGFVLTLICC